MFFGYFYCQRYALLTPRTLLCWIEYSFFNISSFNHATGCILAELYTGYPIFPGENEVEQLACIMEILGVPPEDLINTATRKRLFFDARCSPRCVTNSKGKKRRPGSKSLAQALRCNDALFNDFISRCLEWDPKKRMTPDEAVTHEWLQPSSNSSYNSSKSHRERQERQENAENHLVSPKSQKFQRAQHSTPSSNNTVLPDIKTPNKYTQKVYKERTKGKKCSIDQPLWLLNVICGINK